MSNSENIEKVKKIRRIFCVITQGELGGAQQFVVQLAEHLDRDRFSMHVVWGSDSDPSLARRLPSHVTHAVIRHLVRPWSPWHDVASIFELRRAMRAYQPDVVLLISSKAGFNGALAARPLRKQLPDLKVIYRIGGWQFNDPRPLGERTLYQFLERLSARWKDYIVLNNTHDLDQAKRLGIKPRAHFARIFNGIDPYLSLLEREQARAFLDHRIPEAYRNRPYDFLVGTIANLYPAKDIATLIQAAARVSGKVRFVVIGDGPLRSELERMVIEHGLADRFFILGRIERAAQYLPGLDAFVLPSAKEGFPWALLEAMAAKVPVVATTVGAIPEMIDDHVSGLLVSPGNATAMAHAIVELLSNDRLRQDVAIDAHQRVITRFTLRDMVAQFERLFS